MKKKAWKEARMSESMGHSASLADGSYAAMCLNTIDLGALSFWRPSATAHPAHGLRRAWYLA